MRDDRGSVGGVVVHVVAVADLCRPAMAASVMGDHAVAPFDEVEHLHVPIVGAQWLAVIEDDRLPGTPVLVEDIDAVFGRDRTHDGLSIWSGGGRDRIGNGDDRPQAAKGR